MAQQARNEIGEKGFLKSFGKKKKGYVEPAGKVGCAVERFAGVGKKVSGHKSGNANAEPKTRNIKKM